MTLRLHCVLNNRLQLLMKMSIHSLEMFPDFTAKMTINNYVHPISSS